MNFFWFFLFLICVSLLSCNKGSVNLDCVTEQRETRYSSFRISLPNEKNSIRYSFIENSFMEEFRKVDINIKCNKDSSKIQVGNAVFAYTPLSKPLSQEFRNLNTDRCVSDLFIARLGEIDNDTCVYDSYSQNNSINSSIYFVDQEGVVNYIPFRGAFCSKEKGKTKLDSIEYDLRSYLTSTKAWEGLFKGVSSNKKRNEVLDTLIFRKSKVDKRLSDGKILFYPVSKFVEVEDLFIQNIDSLDYYLARLEGDSVFYFRNIKGNLIQYEDSDIESLNSYLSLLNSFEREFWSAHECSENKQAILWNDSTFNLVSYSCATKEQQIHQWNQEIKTWFEKKIK